MRVCVRLRVFFCFVLLALSLGGRAGLALEVVAYVDGTGPFVAEWSPRVQGPPAATFRWVVPGRFKSKKIITGQVEGAVAKKINGWVGNQVPIAMMRPEKGEYVIPVGLIGPLSVHFSTQAGGLQFTSLEIQVQYAGMPRLSSYRVYQSTIEGELKPPYPLLETSENKEFLRDGVLVPQTMETTTSLSHLTLFNSELELVDFLGGRLDSFCTAIEDVYGLPRAVLPFGVVYMGSVNVGPFEEVFEIDGKQKSGELGLTPYNVQASLLRFFPDRDNFLQIVKGRQRLLEHHVDERVHPDQYLYWLGQRGEALPFTGNPNVHSFSGLVGQLQGFGESTFDLSRGANSAAKELFVALKEALKPKQGQSPTGGEAHPFPTENKWDWLVNCVSSLLPGGS